MRACRLSPSADSEDGPLDQKGSNSVASPCKHSSKIALAFLMLLLLTGCNPSAPLLEQPDSIIVYSDGAEAKYAEGEAEYQTAYAALRDEKLCSVLERCITPYEIDAAKKEQCVEFIYEDPRSLQQGSVTREYDRILFCFSGSLSGEMVLGLNDGYQSGTYRMDDRTWPFQESQGNEGT